MTAKAMHVEYFSDLSLEELTMAEALMTAKASIGTTHPGNGKSKQFDNKVKQKGKFVIRSNAEMEPTYDKGIEAENKAKRKREESNGNTLMEPNCDKGNAKSAEVDYKVKPKRKIASSSNAEKEHTFDKGTQVDKKAKRKREEERSDNIEAEPNCNKGIEAENKAKRKREESNGNTEMEPNCDQVFESTQVYKEPTSRENEDKQNTNILESQKEEANPVKNKGQYAKRTTYEFDNILLEKSTKFAKSIHINHPEPYKEVIEADKKFNAINFDAIEQEIQEEMAITPTQKPINETIKDPINLNYSQEIKQMVTTIENHNSMDVVNDDFDLFENLEYVLSCSSPLSLKSSSHIVPPSAIQQEEINKAIEGIENFLNKNLEDILANSEERATFDCILPILEIANDKEISIELKAFIASLKESVARILNQYSLCETNVRAFTKLKVEKQEIQQLGQVGKKEMNDINNEIFKCKTIVESYTIEISSLEQQLSALQQKLADAKACYETNVQKMSMLQAKKKSICENAKILLERGKTVMQSRVSVQSKHDEALHQQASLEKEWTILKEAFLVNKLKFKN